MTGWRLGSPWLEASREIRSESCALGQEGQPRQDVAKGQIQGFIKAKGPPDVVVAITDGPVLLADFKDSSADRFSLSNISTHQAQRFDEWHGPGRAAAVLLRLQGRRFVVPWEPLRIAVQSWHQSRAEHGRAQAGSASLSLEQLQEVGLPFDSSGWLEPLMSWWRSQ